MNDDVEIMRPPPAIALVSSSLLAQITACARAGEPCEHTKGGGLLTRLKKQGFTDEDIEKKLCTPVYDKSGSSVLFGKKKSKR